MPRGDLDGFEATIRTFKKLKDRAGAQAEAGVKEIARLIYERSQYYCPVDTSKLKTEAFYQVTVGGQGKDYSVESEVVYPTYYAPYVHEMIEKYHEAPTQAKFLEQAVRDVWKDAINVMGAVFTVTYGSF